MKFKEKRNLLSPGEGNGSKIIWLFSFAVSPQLPCTIATRVKWRGKYAPPVSSVEPFDSDRLVLSPNVFLFHLFTFSSAGGRERGGRKRVFSLLLFTCGSSPSFSMFASPLCRTKEGLIPLTPFDVGVSKQGEARDTR